MTTREPISYAVFQKKTVFIPLRYVYPECMLLIADHPQMYPLRCFADDGCPVVANCGEIIAHKINYLFQEVVPKAEIIVAYYKYPDRPQSIRGAVFNRNLDPPNIRLLNTYALRKFLREATPFNWYPSDEYSFLAGTKDILVVPEIL
jgi:hypothetical protein